MKCNAAIAILREKAAILEQVQYRICSVEDCLNQYKEALLENPEEEWRKDCIEEYKVQLDALNAIMQAVFKC